MKHHTAVSVILGIMVLGILVASVSLLISAGDRHMDDNAGVPNTLETAVSCGFADCTEEGLHAHTQYGHVSKNSCP